MAAIVLEDMVTVAEAAHSLGVSRQMVDLWVNQGELTITQTAWGTRLIERDALQVFASQRALAPKDKAGRVKGPLHRKGNRQAA